MGGAGRWCDVSTVTESARSASSGIRDDADRAEAASARTAAPVRSQPYLRLKGITVCSIADSYEWDFDNDGEFDDATGVYVTVPGGFSIEQLWKHSIACGAASQALAKEIRFAGRETCFIAGLIHDIGKTDRTCY